MNEDPYAPAPSLHIPFTVLALAIAVLLVAQIGASRKSAEIMAWQRDTLEKQITSMQTLDKQLAEEIAKREPLVKQSAELQNQLQSLCNDLLDLAKDDSDSKQIVEKWKIQRAPTPAAEEKKDEKENALIAPLLANPFNTKARREMPGLLVARQHFDLRSQPLRSS